MSDSSKPIRVTYTLPPDLADQVRDLAWWDRQSAGEVVADAIREHIATREARRGEAYPKRAGRLKPGRRTA